MHAVDESHAAPLRSRTLDVSRDPALSRGRVYIVGKLNDAWRITADANCGICNLPVPVRVRSGDYYVVGDNRGESADSR
jgi:hypothetical protein